MSRSLAQEKMEEFLKRQEEYEKVYRTYEFIQRPIHSQQSIDRRPHKIRDAVKDAHSRYIEMKRSLLSKTKNEDLQRSEPTSRNKQYNEVYMLRKQALQDNQQIDIGLVLVIFIPVVCFLTLLSELI